MDAAFVGRVQVHVLRGKAHNDEVEKRQRVDRQPGKLAHWQAEDIQLPEDENGLDESGLEAALLQEHDAARPIASSGALARSLHHNWVMNSSEIPTCFQASKQRASQNRGM